MKPMSPETQAKMQQSVEKAGELIESGLCPNDAIVKVASEEKLMPGHVRLLVQSYNIGQTAKQRLENDDVLAKSATFPLANAEEILETLWPSTHKTAAQIDNETAVSKDYSRPPVFLEKLVQKQRQEVYVKTAAVEKVAGLAPAALPPLPTEPIFEMRRVFGEIDRKKQAAAQMRSKLAGESIALADSLGKLDEYFRLASGRPYSEIKAALSDNFADPYMNGVLNYVGNKLPKQIREKAGASLLPRIDWDQMPYTLLKKAAVQSKRMEELQQPVAEIEKEAAAFEKAAMAPYLATPLPKVGGSVLDKPGEKRAVGPVSGAMLAGVSGTGTRSVLDSVMGNDTDKLVAKKISDIDTPEHLRDMQSIQAQVLLDDLINNDPVISGYDPHEVGQAYNQLASLSPTLARDKLLMTGLLRRQLAQGQLDPFEGKAIAETENTLRERQRLPFMQQQQQTGRQGGFTSALAR